MSEEDSKPVLRRFRSPSGRKIRECYTLSAPAVAMLREISKQTKTGRSQLVEVAVFTFYKEHVSDKEMLENMKALEKQEMERVARKELNRARTERRNARIKRNKNLSSEEDMDDESE